MMFTTAEELSSFAMGDSQEDTDNEIEATFALLEQHAPTPVWIDFFAPLAIDITRDVLIGNTAGIIADLFAAFASGVNFQRKLIATREPE